MLLELSRKYAPKSIKHECIDELIRKFGGGDSGIRTLTHALRQLVVI